jgi:hypothetical protein
MTQHSSFATLQSLQHYVLVDYRKRRLKALEYTNMIYIMDQNVCANYKRRRQNAFRIPLKYTLSKYLIDGIKKM